MPAAPDRWRAMRAEFPIAMRLAWLDVPAELPFSRRAAEEGQRYFLERLAGDGVGREHPHRAVAHVRRRLAGLLGADADDVVPIESVGRGLDGVARALAPGTHVVGFADDRREVTRAFERHGHRVTRVASEADGTIAPDAVAAALGSDGGAVVTSTILHECGVRHDLPALAALCRSRGALLVADASPSIGLHPLALPACDPDVVLCGLAGGGGMLYRHPRVASLLPHAAASPEAVQMAGVMALGGALDLIVEMDPSAIDMRVHELTEYLHLALDAARFEVRSPRAHDRRANVTIVGVPDAPLAASRLAGAGILTGVCPRGLRVSLYACTVEQDLDRLVAALDRLRRGEALSPIAPPGGRRVCVDLNGVLDAYHGWRGADHWDPPRPGARDFLRQLREAGCRVIVFTTRHYRGVWAWLLRHDMADFVEEVTDRKPPADVFIDDHAVCFRGDYRTLLHDVLAFRPHWHAGDPGSQ